MLKLMKELSEKLKLIVVSLAYNADQLKIFSATINKLK